MDISVIIPLYKGKKYINQIVRMIEENIECLNNTFDTKKDIEVVFINDFPSELITTNDIPTSGIPISLVTNKKNVGIHQSRIYGVNKSKGEYILFLDQDDYISNDYMKSQMVCIKDADAVLCNGTFRNQKRIYFDEEVQRRAITKDGYLSQKDVIISPGQVIFKRTAIPKEWITFPLKENGSDDIFLWVLFLNNGIKWNINCNQVYIHVEEGDNTSFNFKEMKNSVIELWKQIETLKVLSRDDEAIFFSALKGRIEKYDKYIDILENWEFAVEKLCLEITKNNYNSIALYGYGIIGKKLLKELEYNGIKVEVIIDRDAEKYTDENYKITTIEGLNKKVDMIVVTPLFDKEKIVSELKGSGWVEKIITLDEVERLCDSK